MLDIDKLTLLARWLKTSKYTVVLTGAGCSVDSGVPDFRSKDGWWNNIDPRTVATTEALQHNYDLFCEFYRMRIEALDQCQPHEGHLVLSRWERDGIISCIATQNVDQFHQLAGNRLVYELHGTIRTTRCHKCKNVRELRDFIEKKDCVRCGGRLRPNVVLFGETLPQQVWNQALSEISKAELVLVIGTSLQVSPVNQLPFMTKGKIAILNAEKTEEDQRFDLVLHGRAKELLVQLDKVIYNDL